MSFFKQVKTLKLNQKSERKYFLSPLYFGSENDLHLPPQTIKYLKEMKKFFLNFAIIALVLTFTSCKETPAEATEDAPLEAVETPAENTIEAVETPVEEVVDTTGNDGNMVEDNTNTTSVE
ncbi:MAG: hypothetical protein WBL21_14055 [Salinimicrobium sp.]